MPDEKQNKRMWDGEKDECLFTEPFIHEVFRENDSLVELFQKVEGMHDHRLLAIVTAMLVENRVDNFNSLFLPKYNKLLKSNNFTFSVKIHLLESFNFIPHNIILSANCIREIRNEFAHSLEKQDFSQIKSGILDKLRSISHNVYRNAGHNTDDRKDLLKSFKKLSFFCIAGIHSYAGNIKLLRDEISKKEFISELKQISIIRLRDSNAFIEKAIQGNPIKVEIKSKNKYETFEGGELFPKGIVRVTPISEENFEAE